MPPGGEARLDRSAVVLEGHAGALIRELRDLDGDGRAELALALHTSSECGNAGEESTTFHWLDGDTLRPQLAIEHDALAFGCSGTRKERSGISLRDRNGDGRVDFGVRHAVWSDGCDEIDGWPDPAAGTPLTDPAIVRRLAMGEPMWMIAEADGEAEDVPEPTCPFFDERLRFLYDATTDTWRAAGTD